VAAETPQTEDTAGGLEAAIVRVEQEVDLSCPGVSQLSAPLLDRPPHGRVLRNRDLELRFDTWR
jgi:hypothetical protein